MEVSDGPVLATVVPLLNEGQHVGPLLRSLLEQTLSPTLHTDVLVDGGSADNTLDVIESVLADWSNPLPKVHVLHNPDRPVAHARNMALAMLPSFTTSNIRFHFGSTISAEYMICACTVNSARALEPVPLAPAEPRVAAAAC